MQFNHSPAAVKEVRNFPVKFKATGEYPGRLGERVERSLKSEDLAIKRVHKYFQARGQGLGGKQGYP